MRENFDRFLSNLYGFNELPVIIFLSEVWIYDYELSFYNIPHYSSFGCCNGNYRAGGVCVFYRESLDCTCESISLNSADIIKLTLAVNGTSYIFVCAYRFQFVPISNFVNEFSVFIEQIKNKNLIILGDLNIDILNFNPRSDEYLFLMSSNGLQSLINSPTRITSVSSTCIDHCFVRYTRSCKITASLHNFMISDHHLICGVLENCDIKKIIKNAVVNDFRKINHVELSARLALYDFSSLFFETDPSVILTKFITMFKSLYDPCVLTPKKMNSSIKLKPWISYPLINLMARKKKIARKCRKHPSNTNLNKYYNKLCQKIDAMVISDKHTFYQNKFQQCGNDSKKTWNVVNQILGGGPGNGIDKISTCNSVILTDSETISNDFGLYFSNIVSDLRKVFKLSSNSDLLFNGYDLSISENFFTNPVDASEILGIINNLKPSNSIDILGISSNVLKFNKEILVPIFVHFINQSFFYGVVPELLKIAVVIPLFKKGDKLLKENYRPISLQPTILKIMEKALKLRIDAFLSKHNFHSNFQYGFRSGKNTELALIEFLNRLHVNINGKKFVGSVFIDIKRAFDMVDHNLLLGKLNLCGFRGIPHKWFKSYLSDRLYKVKIANCFSLPFKANFGVPQGSVLGPLLFLIYINSIFGLCLKGKIIAFADDMALTYSGSSPSEISNDINCDMKLLRTWLDHHSLILSEKTKIMFFRLVGDPYLNYVPAIISHAQNCNTINCSNICIKIDHVYQFKYLGLHLDTNLNWKPHFQKIKEQINCSLRAMYLLRSFCPLSVLRNFYHACVESRLAYGLPCWGGVYMNTFKPLYILQKYIVRVMYFKKRNDHSWPMFVIARILPLQHLYVYKVLKLFFSRSGHRLLRVSSIYDVRSNHRHFFRVPVFNTEAFRMYFLVSAPTFFNRLPHSLRVHLNHKHLIKFIKDWLFNTSDINFLFAH